MLTELPAKLGQVDFLSLRFFIGPARTESFALFSYKKEFLFFLVAEFQSVLGIASAFMGEGI
jgi:hypothetical protein